MNKTFQGPDASLETISPDIPDRIGHMYLITSRARGQYFFSGRFWLTIVPKYHSTTGMLKACAMLLSSGMVNQWSRYLTHRVFNLVRWLIASTLPVNLLLLSVLGKANANAWTICGGYKCQKPDWTYNSERAVSLPRMLTLPVNWLLWIFLGVRVNVNSCGD